MDGLTFRLAVLADLPAAAAVHIESCLDIYRGYTTPEFHAVGLPDNLAAVWRDEVLSNGDFIVLAELEGRVVGLSTVRPTRYEQPYIDHFHISPACKRMGLGRRLMRATFTEMQRRGLSAPFLDVAKGNDDALAFYRSMGGVVGDEVMGDLFGFPVRAIIIRWNSFS
ncbi:MAG: GNAT family N-acetyltransferase [Pikeienuella sp.]